MSLGTFSHLGPRHTSGAFFVLAATGSRLPDHFHVPNDQYGQREDDNAKPVPATESVWAGAANRCLIKVLYCVHKDMMMLSVK
jgi:hypothetical protein